MARVVAMVVVVALAAMPAGALGAAGEELGLGQPAPIAPGPAPQNSLTPEAPAPVDVPEDQGPLLAEESDIGPVTLVLVGAVVALLIGGIWYAIARDARRATAGRRVQTAGDGLGGGGSATRAARRSRKLSAAERRRRKRGRAR